MKRVAFSFVGRQIAHPNVDIQACPESHDRPPASQVEQAVNIDNLKSTYVS
jgi:hypothetical protein